jgi:hypothetical protein
MSARGGGAGGGRRGSIDEQVHAFDPEVWSWNESWYFSWIHLDLDRGPAGFFRLGLLPNQRRAMLWCYVHRDGEWLGIDESRLRSEDFDLADGFAYDRWGLRFSWRPGTPSATFRLEGVARTVTGPDAGALTPLSVTLAATPTTDRFGTGTGGDVGSDEYPASRFEQSLAVSGTITAGGPAQPVRAAGHRDRSWGPRDWRVAFTLGDLQAEHAQLYFVGPPQLGERGAGYLRDASGVRHLTCVGGAIEYDDRARTISPARLRFDAGDGASLDVELEPISLSVSFDMSHTCEEPEHWLYWRILVEARVSGWPEPVRGWIEASRYGCA